MKDKYLRDKTTKEENIWGKKEKEMNEKIQKEN